MFNVIFKFDASLTNLMKVVSLFGLNLYEMNTTRLQLFGISLCTKSEIFYIEASCTLI